MQEKKDFRNNLQRIDEHFPHKEMLNIADVSSFTGIERKKVGIDWGKNFVQVGKSKYISKAALARLISA